MIWIALAVLIAALVAYRVMNRVDIDHLPDSFLVFVLETTGPDPERHEIIEIGAIRVGRDATVLDTFRSLVKPAATIPGRVTELTGITQLSIDREGKPLPEVVREFKAFVGDLPMVGFNADLGMAFLGNASQRSGASITNEVSCARKMTNRAWPERKSQGLSDLARSDKAIDKSNSAPKHRVLDDCRKVLAVYLAAASRLGKVS